MRLVVIESPYAGDIEENTAYARAALKDALGRGEAPIASHLLHTQVLDDSNPAQRLLGMEAGRAWIAKADALVVYVDRGISPGMRNAMALAESLGTLIEMRILRKPMVSMAG